MMTQGDSRVACWSHGMCADVMEFPLVSQKNRSPYLIRDRPLGRPNDVYFTTHNKRHNPYIRPFGKTENLKLMLEYTNWLQSFDRTQENEYRCYVIFALTYKGC